MTRSLSSKAPLADALARLAGPLILAMILAPVPMTLAKAEAPETETSKATAETTAAILPAPPTANPKRGQPVKARADKPSSVNTEPADEKFSVSMPAEEKAFRAKVREMLGTFVNADVSDADLKALKAVETAASKGRLETLVQKRAEIKDPVAGKIADWLRLRAGFADAADYGAFLTANRYWPSRRLLRRKMEDIALTRGGTAQAFDALFTDIPPITGAGFAAFASAKLALGEKEAAAKLARRAWRENMLSNSFETGFLERFGDLLRAEDHVARVRRLLSKNYTATKSRNGRAQRVRRMLPLMEDADQRLATALLSVYLDQKGANKLVAALPKAVQNGPDVARQRAQRDYRAGKFAEAADRIAKVPGGATAAAPNSDWETRRDIAFKLIREKDYKRAYAAVKDARPDDINARKRSSFVAGWLALRYLKKPEVALEHFNARMEASDGPLSKAKSHYWIGRAHRIAGRDDAAEQSFSQAAQFRDTFHGALARVAMRPANRALTLPLPELPTDADVSAFKARDVIKAGIIADKAGLSRGRVRGLFGEFTWRVKSAGEIVLAAELAEQLGDGQIAVRAGKAGVARGHALYIYSYPIHRLPAFDPLRPPPNAELLLAIARQESEFNTKIVSRVGARGVLQVMPITARHVCRNYRMKCEIKRLLSDESYNARIAAAYIAEQSQVVRGNTILTLTSYNAGPGRTRQWLRERGDPRSAKIDPLDWVYKIPFEETRLYVQKVMSNMQVYRARLGVADPVQVDFELGIARVQRAATTPEPKRETSGSD
ncbi:MAG: lytic transglycosylase domain-containing protein [Pseudomonadota bacterium]